MGGHPNASNNMQTNKHKKSQTKTLLLASTKIPKLIQDMSSENIEFTVCRDNSTLGNTLQSLSKDGETNTSNPLSLSFPKNTSVTPAQGQW